MSGTGFHQRQTGKGRSWSPRYNATFFPFADTVYLLGWAVPDRKGVLCPLPPRSTFAPQAPHPSEQTAMEGQAGAQ